MAREINPCDDILTRFLAFLSSVRFERLVHHDMLTIPKYIGEFEEIDDHRNGKIVRISSDEQVQADFVGGSTQRTSQQDWLHQPTLQRPAQGP
jgi:hypothetical protein